MLVLRAESFIMGSPASEEGRLDDEEPRRKVITATIRRRQVRDNVRRVERLCNCRAAACTCLTTGGGSRKVPAPRSLRRLSWRQLSPQLRNMSSSRVRR